MKLPKFSLFVFLFIILSCNKGTRENPIEEATANGQKFKHLKYHLYESDFQNKKTIVEKIVYFDDEDKKFHSLYADQLLAEEPQKSVTLTYSSVIDLPSYKELKGTAYALDKNRVYFLDTVINQRKTIYDADPKTFIPNDYEKKLNKKRPISRINMDF